MPGEWIYLLTSRTIQSTLQTQAGSAQGHQATRQDLVWLLVLGRVLGLALGQELGRDLVPVYLTGTGVAGAFRTVGSTLPISLQASATRRQAASLTDLLVGWERLADGVIQTLVWSNMTTQSIL